MSYNTRLTSPQQAATEFGRAVFAGLGFDIHPVTEIKSKSMSLRKRGETSSKYSPKRLKFSPVVSTATSPSLYRSQLGRKLGKYSTRRITHKVGGTEVKDRVLSIHRLINVPWSADEAVVNRRRSNLVNVKGVRFRAQFAHLAGDYVGTPLDSTERGRIVPIEFRWAVINPKQNDGAFKGENSFDSEWWISRDPTEQMSENFNLVGDYHTYQNNQINREKYGVVKEGRFMLTPMMAEQESTAGLANTKSMQAHVEFYLPINKQMKFQNNNLDTASAFPETNLYFVFWYTAMNDMGVSQVFDGGVSKSVPFKFKWEATTYFQNSAMYR